MAVRSYRASTLTKHCIGTDAGGAERHLTPARCCILLLLSACQADTASNCCNVPREPRNMRYLHTMLRVRNLDAAM